MRLALSLGYLSGESGSVATDAAHALDLTRVAQDAGYAQVWVGEAYGTDAPSVLGWLAAQTSTIGLGSAVMQVPARSPASAAMTAASLDALSGGRFHLGLGVSGPQVSAGWHGVAFDKPLARTRAYVETVRAALARQPVRHEGASDDLPALRLAMPAPRADLPLYLAALGPRNTELAGEIADGWLPVFFSPEHAGEAMGHLAAGRARAQDADGAFDVAPTVPLVVTGTAGATTDDAAGESAAAMARLAGHTALYVGGMGSRTMNVYRDAAARMGHGEVAGEVTDHFLSGRRREAAAAVPLELMRSTGLVGDPDEIAARLVAHAAAGVTTVCVSPMAATPAGRQRALAVVADALSASGARS